MSTHKIDLVLGQFKSDSSTLGTNNRSLKMGNSMLRDQSNPDKSKRSTAKKTDEKNNSHLSNSLIVVRVLQSTEEFLLPVGETTRYKT